MNFLIKVENVLSSNLLINELTFIPQLGAALEQIVNEEKFMIRPLSEQHKELLKKWNGINLDVIQFFGCDTSQSDAELKNNQELLPREIKKGIIIASDPSGFLYIEDEEGKIFLLDTDGGQISIIASSLEDLICNYIFGNRAEEFGGKEWKRELEENKII